MSRENVEVIRRAFEVFNARDIEALRELYDPYPVMFHLDGWPEPGPSVGRNAIMAEIERLADPCEGSRLQVVGDFVEVADHVLVSLVWQASSRGPAATMEFSTLYGCAG